MGLVGPQAVGGCGILGARSPVSEDVAGTERRRSGWPMKVIASCNKKEMLGVVIDEVVEIPMVEVSPDKLRDLLWSLFFKSQKMH